MNIEHCDRIWCLPVMAVFLLSCEPALLLQIVNGESVRRFKSQVD